MTLGRHLKYMREQLQQSVEEVSGAVEIDERTLQNIEAGEERPAEDILLLLISYYGLQDQQAVQLWELAEYDAADAPDQIKPDADFINGKNVVMLLAMDTRTLYSDGVDIAISPAGLTLNFTQASGKSQSMPIGRIGVSLEQAEEVAKTLQLAILKAKQAKAPKQLPPHI
jgi:DNA-binding XRE family transcriptional regulator